MSLLSPEEDGQPSSGDIVPLVTGAFLAKRVGYAGIGELLQPHSAFSRVLFIQFFTELRPCFERTACLCRASVEGALLLRSAALRLHGCVFITCNGFLLTV